MKGQIRKKLVLAGLAALAIGVGYKTIKASLEDRLDPRTFTKIGNVDLWCHALGGEETSRPFVVYSKYFDDSKRDGREALYLRFVDSPEEFKIFETRKRYQMTRVIASNGTLSKDGTSRAVLVFTEDLHYGPADQSSVLFSYLADIEYSRENPPKIGRMTEISKELVPYTFLKTGDRETHVLMTLPFFNSDKFYVEPLNSENCKEPTIPFTEEEINEMIDDILPEEIWKRMKDRLPEGFGYSGRFGEFDVGTNLEIGVIVRKFEFKNRKFMNLRIFGYEPNCSPGPFYFTGPIENEN